MIDRTLPNFFLDINPYGPVPNFHRNFVVMASCLVADLGISDRTREQLPAEYAEIGYAPTNNRHVIGSMNELAFSYDYLVSEAGGIHRGDIPKIIRNLNGMPMSILAEGTPGRTCSARCSTGITGHSRREGMVQTLGAFLPSLKDALWVGCVLPYLQQRR